MGGGGGRGLRWGGVGREVGDLRVVVGLGCGWSWGAVGGWMPLPTRPQRYFDPASLVDGQTDALRAMHCARWLLGSKSFISAIWLKLGRMVIVAFENTLPVHMTGFMAI